MSLEDDFEQAVQEWVDHCATSEVCLSSSPNPVRDCDAYRRICSIGHMLCL